MSHFSYIVPVQFSHSVVSNSATPWMASTPSFPVHHQLSEPTQTYAHRVNDVIQPSHPLLSHSPPDSILPTNRVFSNESVLPLLLLPAILPTNRVFSNESVLHDSWPKYWSFSFSISPSNEYSGLISFRMDWLYLLAIQGNLKSLPQQHSAKASILQHSAFFIVQLSHLYMTTGKTIALTRNEPLLAKQCLCFLMCCLGWS